MKTETKQIEEQVQRPHSEMEFDVFAFLKAGRTSGYVIRSIDGKPFLLKYKEPVIKEGRLHRFVIWLIDPNVSRKDIICPSYVSKTFSHFFGAGKDVSEDYLELDDGGLVVAEIALEADESELLHLIADLNYSHIKKEILGKYYSTHRGEYDSIGRSMVGIAGKVLFEAYGIRFLGVRTDKTKGFYWEISERPPKNPTIPSITSQMGKIRDIKIRREIRDDFYINIVKKIAFKRFDPYIVFSSDISIEDSWERHCKEIWSILSGNEPLFSRLLNESRYLASGGTKEFIEQMMVQYRKGNVQWFTSLNGAVQKLIKVNQIGDKQERDCIIDVIINLEQDSIVRKELAKLKQPDLNADVIEIMNDIIGYHNSVFPVFDLGRIEEIEIGIRPHKDA